MDVKRRISRVFAEFTDPAEERVFRVATHRYTALQNKATALIAAVVLAGFGLFDYLTLGLGPTFYALAGARLLVVLAAAGVVWGAREPERVRRADMTVLVFQAAVGASIVYLLSARTPVGFLYSQGIASITVVLVVLGNYIFVVTRAPYSVLGGLATSAGYLAAGLASGRHAPTDALLEGIVLLTCNLLGFWMVNRIRWLYRRQHANFEAERAAKERLETQSEELRLLAHNLEHARDEATLANRAKSEFLAHMSHELRSPLNAILGFAEVMQNRLYGPVRPERYVEYVDDIHASGTHLLAVINDILDLSKAESGKLQLNETIVAPRAVVSEVLRLIRQRALSHTVVLRNDVDERLPTLRADARMVKQMLLNLLTNAVKFTPAGGHVWVEGVREPDGALSLRVIDTGIGIKREDIPKVLEAYGQAEVARNRSQEGTGLGLPLVKSMITLHDGALLIESEPGEGTIVTVRFPTSRVVNYASGDLSERAAG